MDEDDIALVKRMISESGEMWMAARDRLPFGVEPIIICRDPEHSYYLTRVENYVGDNVVNVGGWVIEKRPLRMSDAAEFFAEFGFSWPIWKSATLRNAPFRAYIKNGRSEGWSISLDMKADLVATTILNDLRSNGPIREALRNI